MGQKIENLSILPKDPFIRLLAVAELDITAEINAPASADSEYVLRCLAAANQWEDFLLALAVALPPRQAVWWACYAARDYIKLFPKTASHCVDAAEAWVVDPQEPQRKALETVLQNCSPRDKTSLCATAALYANGTLGTGEMNKLQAPPALLPSTVFGINMLVISEAPNFENHIQWVMNRGLDIAKGGIGRVARPPLTPEPVKSGDA